MENYRLNFHQTFAPDLSYLSKILLHYDKIKELTKEEISNLTGIPTGKVSGKVVPHIDYLKYMNLIEYNVEKNNYSISLTPLGVKVFKEDSFLSERITKTMLNYFLTSKRFGAHLWYYIFRELVSVYGNKINTSIILSETEKSYNKKVNLSPFNGTYLNNNCFYDLNILNITDRAYSFNSLGFEYEGLYMYLYTLLLELKFLDINRKEFTYDEIFKIIKWNLGFQWSEIEAIKVLERFESKGLIGINRQLNPITIILKVTDEEVITDIYSLLI